MVAEIDSPRANIHLRVLHFRLTDILAAISLAHICFLTVWRELLFASSADRYWMPEYSTETYVAAILNTALFSVLIWACLSFLVRSQQRRWIVLGAILIFSLLVFPLNYLRMVLGVNENTVNFVKDDLLLFIPLSLILAAVGVYLLVFHVSTVTKFIIFICLILSPFAALDLIQAGFAAVPRQSSTGDTLGDAGQEAPKKAPARIGDTVGDAGQEAPKKAPVRIVWVLMDELDLRLAFLERPAGLELPEFDRLRNQAFFAWNGKSYSRNTAEAIPSFLIQKIVDQMVPKSRNESRLTFDPVEATNSGDFSEFPNFFGEAAEAGARTAIIGFYHPYCRLFADQVARCEQYSVNTYAPRTSTSITEAMFRQLIGITPLVKRINGVTTFKEMQHHILQVVGASQYDVVYVHASVPHGPNIWDDRRNTFTLTNTSKDGYFSNLKLADRLLGNIRQAMEQEGLWDNSVFLLTSDHEWRHVYLYDHQRIRKIPFVLKMPGQQDTFDFKQQFAPMRLTKDLLLQIRAGNIATPSEVANWIQTRLPSAQ